jgi:hypothetical protein
MTDLSIRQVLVGVKFIKASIKNRRDDCKGVAAGKELLWWILHPGDLYKHVAEPGGIALLLAVIARPQVFGLSLRCVVLDGAIAILGVPSLQEVCPEEAGCDQYDLDSELFDFMGHRK